MFKKLLLLFFIHSLLAVSIYAQCPAGTFDNTGFFPAFETPSQPGIANERTAHAAWGGDYYLFNVTSGNTYVFRSCFTENSGINTVLSLYNAAGTTLITYNDDFCGTQSQLSWLATFTGQVRLSYYQSGCNTSFIDTKLGIYYTSSCSPPNVTANPINSTVCTSLSTTFSVSTSGTVTGYQWQVNSGSGFVDLVNGPGYTNVDAFSVMVSPATSAMNGYLYRCIVRNTCGYDTSSAATLTVSPNQWTGANSNSWTVAGNWTCGKVPTSVDDVVLNTGSPTVPTGNTASCRNLTKGGSATFNISNATVKVYGNFLYQGGGISTNSTSDIQFAGSGNQTYSSSFVALSIPKLTINGTGTVSINSTLTITGSLNVSSGTLYPNNALVLESTASASAYLSSVAGIIDGRITVQKYIPGKRAFRFMAHPFKSDSTIYLNSLTSKFDITGTGGSTNGFTTTQTNAPSAFYYDNTVSGSGTGINDLGWRPFTSTVSGASNIWKSYQGIRLLIRGALGEGLNGLAYTPSAITLSITGNVNTGNQVISLTRSGSNGYNFIGNPYPSPVDVNASTRSNAGSTFYVWDATLGTAGQYRNISFGSSYVLPAFAGFVVNATAAGSITFTEASKATASTHSLFRNINTERNKLQLKLSSDSITWDYCTVYLNNKAASKKDDLDGEKLFNSSVNLYSISSDNNKLSIDCRSAAQQQTIPLGIIVANQEAFTLTVDELLVDDDKSFFLKDKYLNTTTPLQAGTIYSFTVNNDSLSKGEKRFEIVQLFKEILINANTPQFSVSPNPASDRISVTATFAAKKDVVLNLIASNGVIVQHKSIKDAASINETFSLKQLAAGIYSVQLCHGKETVNKQFVKQ